LFSKNIAAIACTFIFGSLAHNYLAVKYAPSASIFYLIKNYLNIFFKKKLKTYGDFSSEHLHVINRNASRF